MWDRLTKMQRIGVFVLCVLGVAYLSYAGKKAMSPLRSVNLVESSSQGFAGTGEVVIQIGGEVRNPGVYRLRSGQRIQDAIEAAGGPTVDADLEEINRAQVLEDGSHIRVPAEGDQSQLPTVTAPNSLMSPSKPRPSSSSPSNVAGTVSINSASAEMLDTLPGVGPAIAQKIIQYRQQNGGFRTIEEIMEVSGIGEKKFAAMKEYLRL